MLRQRFSRFSNNIFLTYVDTTNTASALGDDIDDLITSGIDGQTSFHYRATSNDPWEAPNPAAMLADGGEFRIVQKVTSSEGVEDIKASTAYPFKAEYFKKVAYTAGQLQRVILSDLQAPTEGDIYELLLIDQIKLMLPYERYTFDYTAQVGDTAEEVLIALAAQINDPTNVVYRAANKQLFQATVDGAGATASMRIVSLEPLMTFSVAKMDALESATVNRTTIALGDITVNGETTTAYKLESGSGKNTLDRERDSKSQDGFAWQNVSGTYNSDYEVPNLYADIAKFYTYIHVSVPKTLTSKAAPITESTEYTAMLWALPQADAVTPVTAYDTLLSL